MLALVGPTVQEAKIGILAGDFLVFMHTGFSPAAAVSWSEDHEGFQLFPGAALDR